MNRLHHLAHLSTFLFGRLFSVVCLVLFVLPMAVSCSRDQGTVQVSGIARLTDGTPLPQGRIMLIGGETGPSGAIQPDGTFRLGTFTTIDGAKPGYYKVVIVGAANPDTRPYEEQSLHPELAPPSLIHSKYSRVETTDIEVEIGTDTNELEFSLEPNPRLKK